MEFVFAQDEAVGTVACIREEHGVRVEVDGRPLLLVDLYYCGPANRNDSRLEERGRVHVQLEAPLPDEDGSVTEGGEDDAWLHFYIGKRGITGFFENSPLGAGALPRRTGEHFLLAGKRTEDADV